jgi:hypothetical protein
VVSAKVFELPARVRCDRAARELREGVIGVLTEIHRHGGDAAFHRAARDLVASVATIVAQVEGRKRMLDVLGLIDRATEAERRAPASSRMEWYEGRTPEIFVFNRRISGANSVRN